MWRTQMSHRFATLRNPINVLLYYPTSIYKLSQFSVDHVFKLNKIIISAKNIINLDALQDKCRCDYYKLCKYASRQCGESIFNLSVIPRLLELLTPISTGQARDLFSLCVWVEGIKSVEVAFKILVSQSLGRSLALWEVPMLVYLFGS